ncbi:MAG TPA: hypothetical protein VNH46_08615 [Gemmatimonadales bacterium]|nr:hypothetical protein [Gemmatimonadales bacterium]
MKLATFWALLTHPGELLTPIRDPEAWPDRFWPHVGAQALGAFGWWCLVMLICRAGSGVAGHAVWMPWVAALACLGAGVFWALRNEEVATTTGHNYPAWSAVWDGGLVALSGAAYSAVAAMVLR